MQSEPTKTPTSSGSASKAEMGRATTMPGTQNHAVHPTALKKDGTYLSGLGRKSPRENDIDQKGKLSNVSRRIANSRKARTQTQNNAQYSYGILFKCEIYSNRSGKLESSNPLA